MASRAATRSSSVKAGNVSSGVDVYVRKCASERTCAGEGGCNVMTVGVGAAIIVGSRAYWCVAWYAYAGFGGCDSTDTNATFSAASAATEAVIDSMDTCSCSERTASVPVTLCAKLCMWLFGEANVRAG